MTYKLGLIHSPVPAYVKDLGCYSTAPLPAPPAKVDAPNVTWPMSDNDRLGDCTIAGAVHLDQAGAAIVGETWNYPGDAKVQSVYFGLTGGPDTGLQLPQVLNPWKAKGLFSDDKNGGFASVNPKDTAMVKRTVWIFGAAYIAVALPEPAQGQFRPDGSGVWDLTDTDADYQIEGGHCVTPVGFSAEGVVTVTWGSTVLITWRWWHQYVSQVYAVVPRGFVEKGGDGRGFDLAAIERDLALV